VTSPAVITPQRPVARSTAGAFGRLLIIIGLLAVAAQGLLVGARWWREQVPDYQAGELADRTVTTPTRLIVQDPAATEAARQREGRRLPPLYRFDARVADQAADRFLKDYQHRHGLFMQGLSREWPLPLGAEEIESARFADYQTAFRLAHPDFPLTEELAHAWATEATAHPLRDATVAILRAALRQYVVEDELPAAAAGHAEVLVTAPVAAGGLSSGAEVESHASRLQRRVMVPLAKARTRLGSDLARHGGQWSDYAARFAAPNITFDEALTLAARADYAREVVVNVEFQPGDSLSATAQPVTAGQAAALNALRQHYLALAQARGREEWWPAALGLLLLVTGILILRLSRPRFHPAARGNLIVSTPALPQPTEAEALRQSLMQQLAGWLKQHFVQRLVQQRNDALAAEAHATSQVDLINQRLTRLQPEIRERVAEYERRIAQLERELTGANEVSTELIKTKISLARKELEIEKAKSNLVWN
jgi:hypothetical protein